MKVLRFKCGEPEWSVSVNELSFGMRCKLQDRWREFLEELDGMGETDQGDCNIKGLMERSFAAADSLIDGENCSA